MVTHGNLLHNSSLIERYCQHPPDAHGVTWLPLYHDLGLIGGILQASLCPVMIQLFNASQLLATSGALAASHLAYKSNL